MKSARPGTAASGVEVTNVSPNGFWLLIGERELFLALEHVPWFADGTIRQLTRVTRLSPHHLYWPDLDVDLAVESLEHPTRILVSKARLPQTGRKRRGRDR